MTSQIDSIQSIKINDLLELDKVIHERVRLGIMASLSVSESLSFQELKRMFKVTDGNLSVHLRLLEKNGYITINKGFIGKKPQTTSTLTKD